MWNLNILTIEFIVCISVQTQKVILALGDYMNAKCHACIGGTRIAEDIMKLSDNVNHIVVGTPGRVNDMMERGALGMSEHLYI